MNKLALYRQVKHVFKTASVFIVLLSVCPTGTFARAESLYVVANSQTPLDNLSRGDVINIYMGRNRSLPNSGIALPLDIDSNYAEKAKFYKKLIKRDLPEVNSYWTRVMFSGDASPPRQVDTYDDIRELVKNNKGAIAYLPQAELDKFSEGEYKVVYVLDE